MINNENIIKNINDETINNENIIKNINDENIIKNLNDDTINNDDTIKNINDENIIKNINDENIIKNINDENIIKNINDNTINDVSDITKQFYIIYYDLLIIKNESIFIENLIKMNNEYNFNNFISINNIKKLIFHLKNENLSLSYKILLLIYIKSDLYNKILFIINEKKDISIFSITEIVNYKINYINSFSLMPLSIKSENIKILNEEKWYYESKYEILNRLEQLHNYFKSSFFKRCEIKMILKSELYSYNYKKINKYYNSIINKIKKIFKKILKLCKVSIEIEKTLLLLVISQDNTIELDKYNLIVDSDLSD
jgi:hypothetical protein